ncbi:hypothetical protein [Gorillibacterium massiliense]|uniref:hypothetical protein n=1 Tax=Gorillibacterium massiliense TaxID=1280390 RepID=UPI0012DC045A|nr:hypothetical protein [Gorillibacterium massiliense]
MLFTSCTKYSEGKDTVLSIGDGSIQILKSGESKNLYDLKKKQNIETGVKNYLIHKNILYIIGEHGFTKVNIKNHTFQQDNRISIFQEKDVEAFTSISSQ